MRLLAALIGAVLSLAATYEAAPETFRSIYDRAEPGDRIHLGPGDYGQVTLDRPGVSLRGGLMGRIFRRLVIQAGAGDAVVEDVEVRDGGLQVVSADRVVLRRVRIAGNAVHGLHVGCSRPPCADVAEDLLVEDCVIERNAWKGVDIDAAERPIFRRNKIRYNGESGWLDGQDSRNGLIEHNEFAYNGTDPSRNKWGGHGMYTKGVSHRVLHNVFHHNTGYGFHCWAACRGTPEAPFLFQFNLLRKNQSGGIVIAGTPLEAQPGDDGWPKYVVAWHNDSCDNGDAGMIP